MKTILASILGLLGTVALASGYTLSGSTYKTDGSQSDVQAAVNAAPDGGIVEIPAGTFSWTVEVQAQNKGITLRGAGSDATTLKNPNGIRSLFGNSLGSKSTRITGITFAGVFALDLAGSSSSPTYRVDNCVFDCGSSPSVIIVELWGIPPGLIDHCTFTGGGASEMIHNNGVGAENPVGWEDNVNPGSLAAMYIENCTFSKKPLEDEYFRGTSAIQNYYGARTVMRHCVLNYCHIDAHGNVPPLYGARWGEYYNNTFYVTPNGNQSELLALRGGSGVVFGNRVTGGPNHGAGALRFYSDESINPPMCGPGAGIWKNGAQQQARSPFYCWDNPGIPVNLTSSNIALNKDIFVSDSQPASMKRLQLTSDTPNTTYSYKPAAYPHPMDDGPADSYGPGAGAPQPTPTPQPSATPTPPLPTPTPPANPTYEHWIEKQNNWIRQNPPTPD